MEMAFPIVEVRENNLFVLTEFMGAISGAEMKMRHNLRSDKTKYVFDSNGTMWTFDFQRADNAGIRGLVSKAWNISSDYYTSTVERNATIGAFRKAIAPHAKSKNPDVREMTEALLDSVEGCAELDLLREKVGLLNL